MKLLTLLFLSVPFYSFSQGFELPKANVQLLREELSESHDSQNIIYLYLNQFFEPKTEREALKTDNPLYQGCSFSQQFDFEILYSEDDCSSNGQITQVVFPKIDRAEVTEWIEQLFATENLTVAHGWNRDHSSFGPLRKGPGCYFTIHETDKHTIVENFCYM